VEHVLMVLKSFLNHVALSEGVVSS
jgi:hypothetical protein